MGPLGRETCILVMVKYPWRGEVKTRLSRQVGEEKVVQLYTCFVKDVLARVQETGLTYMIYYHPQKDIERMRELFGKGNLYLPQEGVDLGERLLNGFLSAKKKGYKMAILLATDIPDITSNILKEASEELRGHDAVIGPSPDGGYYLIGLRLNDIQKEVFENIAWSTETVFEDTMKKLRRKNLRVSLLAPWSDVDTLEDLKRLINNAGADFVDSNTLKFIKNNLERMGLT